jgi:glycosyltransferase involved in cell wall biosynthesis
VSQPSDTLVSVITPTWNREAFLPLAHACFSAQDWPDLEWLIFDNSAEPSAYIRRTEDPRIVYIHDTLRRTIGAVRNLLVERARGSVIVHFDDDDYYAPGYISAMIQSLRRNKTDIAKLLSFYLYSHQHRWFGYWDLTVKTGTRFVVENNSPVTCVDHPGSQGLENVHLGFGFSYVYSRAVWERDPFPDTNQREDGVFIRQAIKRFRLTGINDVKGLALHIHHGSNASRLFPQFHLPTFLLLRLFPGAAHHVRPPVAESVNV